jgi:hypothetical protein
MKSNQGQDVTGSSIYNGNDTIQLIDAHRNPIVNDHYRAQKQTNPSFVSMSDITTDSIEDIPARVFPPTAHTFNKVPPPPVNTVKLEVYADDYKEDVRSLFST